MKSVEFAPAGAMRRLMKRSVRAPTSRTITCLLFAMLLFSACSVLFGSGSVQEPQDEAESDSPVSSLALYSNVTFAARPSIAYVGEEVTFWANATSDVADSLTFRIRYDAYIDPLPTPNPDTGVTYNVTTTPAGTPGRVVQHFTYNSIGNFTLGEITYVYATLLVYETDNPAVNKSKTILVYLKENSPPVFDYDLGDAGVDIDVPLNLSIQVTDPDLDPIDVYWEFGDGTFATNTTNGTYADRFVNQTHVWSPYVEPGAGGFELEFIANVTLVDPFGNNITDSAIITVRVPPNKAPTVPVPLYSANVLLGSELLIFANATDPEGDPLTWMFNYSDGTVDVVHTDETAPGVLVWCNMTHVYDEVGTYLITMTVSDAIGDNQVFPHNMSLSFYVIVEINSIPGVGSKIVVTPETPEIDGMIGYTEVVLSIKVMDLDGDIVTASWYIADAVDPIVNVSGGGVGVFYNFKQYVNLTEPGTYNVTVVVTDGYEGHEVTVSRTFNVTSNNAPPRLRLFNFSYATGEFALPMEEIEFTIMISDAEEDTIEVMLEFGDDSPRLYFNLTEYVDGNVTLIINHTYELPGVYTVTLWFTDNKIGILNHTKEETREVTVAEPFVETVAIWDWWDYTALAMLFIVPVLIVVRMVVIKRRILNLESEGLTLEEARIRAEAKRMDELLTNEKGDG